MKIGIIFSLVFWAHAVWAQTTFTAISNLNQPTSNYQVVSTNQVVANSFTTSNTLTALYAVSVRMNGVPQPAGYGPFELALYDDVNGAPGNRLATLSGESYPTNSGVYTYTNTAQLILMSNTVYWVEGSALNTFPPYPPSGYPWTTTSSTSLDPGSTWSLGTLWIRHRSTSYTLWFTNLTGPPYLEFAVTVTTNLPEIPLISVLPTASAVADGQTLAWSTLSGGAATNSLGAPVPGTFSFTKPWLAPGLGTSNELVTFIPTDTTNYTMAIVSVPVTVVIPETLSISALPSASAITYGQALASSTLSGGAATNPVGTTVPGTFSFTSPWLAPDVGTADQSVTFTPNDTAHYTTATGAVPVTVTESAPWTKTIAPNANWTSIASSADGLRLVAVASGGTIYTSSDSGNTWTHQTGAPLRSWSSVASSADGNDLAAGCNDSSYGIYTSTNAGVTWTTNNKLPLNQWSGVAMSADGSKLVAGSANLYTSTNYGVTWTSNNISGFLNVCASSAGGTTLLAGGGSGPLTISTNSGQTWEQLAFTGTEISFATSADGSKVATTCVINGNTDVSISTNFGISWTSNQVSSQFYQIIAASADGNQLVLATQGGGIYTSPSGGKSWCTNDVPNSTWTAVASSADGSVLAATVQSGGIWTFHSPVSRTLSCRRSGGTNIALSWLVPGTNVVLQQSSDLQNWSPVPDNPTLNLTNLHDELVIPALGTNEFFKLASP